MSIPSTTEEFTAVAFLEGTLTPFNAIVFTICWLLPIAAFTWHRRTSSVRREQAHPLSLFLTELTSGASSGHDRKLINMFHPAIFRRVERGTIRAMSRCVVAKYGAFVSVDYNSLQVHVRGATTSVVAKVDFANAVGVTCQAAWMASAKHNSSGSPPSAPTAEDSKNATTDANASSSTSSRTNPAAFATPSVLNGAVWQIVGFNILPLSEGDFDVLSYVRPDDFVSFGERFVSALFAKSPATAVGLMYKTLQDKYVTETAQAQLTKEVGRVLSACGGLRNRAEVDLTMVDARVVRSGDEEGTRTNGVEMEFAVLGKERDMKVSLKFVFVELRCAVIRYNVSAQPNPRFNQQHVIVDQDQGTHTVLS